MKRKLLPAICGLWILVHNPFCFVSAQTIYQYKSDDATICFFSQKQSQYVPHLMRKYQLGHALHEQVWGELPSQSPFMMLTDWEDDGNAGVTAIPHTIVQIGMAPLNMHHFVSPSNERYDHLFKHEYTHVVMSDKANDTDMAVRRFTGNKVVPNSKYPLSALWSYFDAPRWYAPRWYHEGIACFLETWMADGIGRALGGYDETYFRTNVKDGKKLYSVVGLETEGTTSDFQQGATSYLYGTRFVNYLVLQYGFDKLVQFYNRTDDSHTFYARQFEAVYGKPLREAWEEWQAYEIRHQNENLNRIAEYPLTETKTLSDRNIGAAAPLIFDEERKVAYGAVNYPGSLAQIVEMKIGDDGKFSRIRKLANIDGPLMYQTSYLAYDKKNRRLIWTDRNSSLRGLVVYDLNEGHVVKRLKYQRMYDICYDNVHDCLYGLISNQGVLHLVKYDSELENREVLYSFPFGVSVGDLDVSHDGSKLVASLLGKNGSHSLILFDMSDIDSANGLYTTLCSLDDSNLSQFRFSHDDSRLVGFSYFTGVPNVWQYDLQSGELDLLSNVQTGLFSPYLASDGKVYAFEFSSDGMTPVTFEHKILKDANSVEFLGQKAYEAHPEIAELSNLKESLPKIEFGQVYDSVTVYKPLKEMKFQGAHPDISAFVDRKAWNNMTPVLGYQFAFYDPLSLFSINLFVGASPWSNNAWKNRFHASADIKYMRWKLNAAWNPTSFYDLFGPRRASRKGYQVVLSYDSSNRLQSPFTTEWGASVGHYGDMDALPLYQDREVDDGITSFQTASAYYSCGKMISSLGAITAEQGYKLSANAYTYLAGGKLFPSVDLSADFGVLLPIGQHNSFWLKTSAGQAFGDASSSFGNSYFGGFRNNYVDNGTVYRYRTVSAMPGAKIDQIMAHSYAKATGEINFCPIRFNNFGALQFYPNYIEFCAFAHDLVTDWWTLSKSAPRPEKNNYVSVGAQMNTQLVIFTHLKTTLSVGYARVWGGGLNQGELMVSLKLL
ncbi:MAG: hypothetical protein KBT00_07560 [Bacteroidales bacterium]|nr:hypothetical protein [Candidatus Cacconaster merdequi]